MVMHWLTRDWHGFGDRPLSKAEAMEREATYDRHRQAVLPLLPDDFKALAGDLIDGRYHSLEDGRVESWELELPQRFVITVVAPDGEGGYERLEVAYHDVELVGAAPLELAGWLEDPQTQLIVQEVDALLDGRFEHRHLLWPRGEFAIRFTAVHVATGPASPDEYGP
jgi:hypothetical protein